MTTDIVVPVSRAASHMKMTVTVSGMRTFSFRCQIGLALMRLAAWVMPFNAEVKIDD